MDMRWTLCLGTLVLGLAPGATPQEPRADLLALVEAERSFAATAVIDGVRAAFLAYLAEGAIVFEPEPTDGRMVHQARPVSDDRLEWQPALAGIAASGDLGYTSGPWRFHRAGSSVTSDVYGHYVSVWQKQDDGTWKVAADIGVSHPAAVASDGNEVEVVAPMSPSAVTASAETMASLLEVERAFSERSSRGDAALAYDAYLAEAVRVYRPQHVPLARAEAIALIGTAAGSWSWTPRGGAVSGAGDLGYAYGSATWQSSGDGESVPHSYLRVWRRLSAGWRVEIEVMIPAATAGG
jgi:ketosteroid isomerase-like protein